MLRRLLIAFSFGCVPALPLHGQDVFVSAVLEMAAPTGAGVRNLSFGTIRPLAEQTLLITVPAAPARQSGSVSSGEYGFTIAGIAGLDFRLAVPGQLTRASSGPLDVSFDGTGFGAYCVNTGTGCTLTNFNPANGDIVRVCSQTVGSGACNSAKVFPAATHFSVYVGGELSVPPGTPAGLYTATVTLTLTQVY